MIEAQGLTKFYGSLPAIRDVSFRVDKGEVVGFLGPNGAGKTTAIRILTCYMPATAGVAKIAGLDCLERSLQVRGKVGYLPENNPLYGELTVRRFLRFVAGAKGVDGKKVTNEVSRVTDICGLNKVSERIIGHLSKGFKQRVGLAQALLNNPSVLILDEPTIGLDPTQIIEIRKLIQSLREQHTILLSSHILPEVAQICQRVLIINKGQIIATDTPANLTSQLQKSAQISVQVRGGLERLIPALECHDGVHKVTTSDRGQGGLLVETDRSRDLRPEIARVILDHGLDLLELRLVDLSLEDIFMQLVTEEPAQEEVQS